MPVFTGTEADWTEWAFIFESVVGVAGLEAFLEKVVAAADDMKLAYMNPREKEQAKELY